jgi:hypothetical protein
MADQEYDILQKSQKVMLEGETFEGPFPWSTNAAISDDQEIITPLLFLGLLFVVR